MRCPACRSTAVRHRSERTAQGYRRFRCSNCGKQFNERSAGLLNRAQYPSDVIALVVLWRLRYKLSLRDLAEMFLIRGSSSAMRPSVIGKPNLPRHWLRTCVGDEKAKSAEAGTSTSGAWWLAVSVSRDRSRWRLG